jgi:hypothetical protein
MKHKSLNQLLCAATVNGRFRDMLLRDPAQALAAGYLDHTFSLTPEERELVMGIQAHRLEDFAAQVYCWISGDGNGNGRNGNGNGNGRNGPGNGRMGSDNLRACPGPAESLFDVYHTAVVAHA